LARIPEISSKTGLATSTVAAILRDQPGFKPETRRRVLRVAKELGYRPNYLGRALAGGKSMTIGIVAPMLQARIAQMQITPVASAAEQRGYLAYLVTSDSDLPRSMLSCVENLLDRRIDGLMLFSELPLPEETLAPLKQRPVPTVFLHWAPDSNVTCVRRDFERGIRQVVDHLVSLGHRRVGLTMSAFTYRYPQHKFQIYQETLRAAGIEVVTDASWVHDTSGDRDNDFAQSGYHLIRKQLQKSRQDFPTAVIFESDEAAAGGIRAITEAGLRVPQDVSVVGFDDLPFARTMRPSLTTVHQPRSEFGQKAFEMLH